MLTHHDLDGTQAITVDTVEESDDKGLSSHDDSDHIHSPSPGQSGLYLSRRGYSTRAEVCGCGRWFRIYMSRGDANHAW